MIIRKSVQERLFGNVGIAALTQRGFLLRGGVQLGMPHLSTKRMIASSALIAAGLGILAGIWWKIAYVMAFLIFSPSDWKGFAAVALILLPGFLIASGIANLTKRFDSESIIGWSVLGSIFGAFVQLVAGWNHIPSK